jgi:hypothetical protein
VLTGAKRRKTPPTRLPQPPAPSDVNTRALLCGIPGSVWLVQPGDARWARIEKYVKIAFLGPILAARDSHHELLEYQNRRPRRYWQRLCATVQTPEGARTTLNDAP